MTKYPPGFKEELNRESPHPDQGEPILQPLPKDIADDFVEQVGRAALADHPDAPLRGDWENERQRVIDDILNYGRGVGQLTHIVERLDRAVRQTIAEAVAAEKEKMRENIELAKKIFDEAKDRFMASLTEPTNPKDV